MSSIGAIGSLGRRALRGVACVVLGCAGMTAWVQMATAAGRGWSIEPYSDTAIVSAADARPTAIAWGTALVALAIALAGVTGHRWLAVLGLPGLVVAIALLLAPTGNGAAFFLGLEASVSAVAAALFFEVRHRRSQSRRRAADRPAPN